LVRTLAETIEYSLRMTRTPSSSRCVRPPFTWSGLGLGLGVGLGYGLGLGLGVGVGVRLRVRVSLLVEVAGQG
jgi:hypothetical protein